MLANKHGQPTLGKPRAAETPRWAAMRMRVFALALGLSINEPGRYHPGL